MKDLVTAFCLILLAVLCRVSVNAQDEPPPPPPAPAPKYSLSDWKEFVSAEGHFSVLFPVKPEEQSGKMSTPSGEANYHSFRVNTMDGSYQITYVDLPSAEATPERLRVGIETLKSSLKKQATIKMLGENEIILNEHPGIELRFEAMSGMMTVWL